MSIINEYLVMLESKDQKKNWVNTPLEPLYCLFFLSFFLRSSSAEFLSAVLPSLPRRWIVLNYLSIWLVVLHSDPVYFDPDAELDESESSLESSLESSPDANAPSQLDYSSESSSSPSPSLDEAAAPCSGPALNFIAASCFFPFAYVTLSNSPVFKPHAILSNSKSNRSACNCPALRMRWKMLMPF